MQIFNRPQRMIVYPDGSYRFVSNEKINIGDEINIAQDYLKPIMRTVTAIHEERKSMGVFKDEKERPFSYRISTNF